MDTPRRAWTWALLGLVVVLPAAIYGVSALTASPHTPVPTTAPVERPTQAAQSPAPQPSCSAGQLQLEGAFVDCTAAAPHAAQYCTVSGNTLDDVITIKSATRQYLLYLFIEGGYRGQGDYQLAPWSNGLDVKDGKAKVAVREYVSGAFWQSVSGVLHVGGNQGDSGGVAANLVFVGGEPTPPVTRLGIIGPWSCP